MTNFKKIIISRISLHKRNQIIIAVNKTNNNYSNLQLNMTLLCFSLTTVE